MANGRRIGQLPDDLIGNEGLPSRVVSNERLEMLHQQIRRSAHVDSLRHHLDANDRRRVAVLLPLLDDTFERAGEGISWHALTTTRRSTRRSAWNGATASSR